MYGTDQTRSADLEPRVSSLETAMKAVAADVGNALVKLDHIQSDNNRNYDQIRSEIGKQNKLPVSNILIAVTLILGLVGSWGVAVIAPVKIVQEFTVAWGKERANAIEADVADNRNRIRNLESDLAAFSAKSTVELREVETQFNSYKAMGTLVNAYNTRMDQLLWQKAYGEPLPLLYSPQVGFNGEN
jgi:hypothetical protein